MSEPVLIKIEHTNQIVYGFLERARWRVELDGTHVGDVWRGENGRGVKCWFGESVVLQMEVPLMNSAVVSGYSRTTKSHTVSELVDWHRHQDKTFEMGDWTFHCWHEFKGFGQTKRTFAAVNRVDGRMKSLHANHNAEEKPREGAVGGIGWHVTFFRGNHRFVASEYPDVETAVEVLLPELDTPPSKEEKKHSFYATDITRFYYEQNPQPGV